jgi:hypothetical protein
VAFGGFGGSELVALLRDPLPPCFIPLSPLQSPLIITRRVSERLSCIYVNPSTHGSVPRTYDLSTKVLSIEHGAQDGQDGAICEPPPPSGSAVRRCRCAPGSVHGYPRFASISLYPETNP